MSHTSSHFNLLTFIAFSATTTTFQQGIKGVIVWRQRNWITCFSTGSNPDASPGPQCQWRYDSCAVPCFKTCSDPSAESCATIPQWDLFRMSDVCDDLKVFTVPFSVSLFFMVLCCSLHTEWRAAFLSVPQTWSWMRSPFTVSMLKTVSICFTSD